jgi:ribonucleotide monophosphatase NagD (HAD superfamily)
LPNFSTNVETLNERWLMATKWEYKSVENYQQAAETRTDSALRWIRANADQGWEFDRILDFGEGEFLLFRRQVSN